MCALVDKQSRTGSAAKGPEPAVAREPKSFPFKKDKSLACPLKQQTRGGLPLYIQSGLVGTKFEDLN